jgi:CPA2 family monovalent cation:H+ antiporter-2
MPLAVAAPGAPPGAFDMLTDLALIMCVAAVTTVLFQRIRQPVVLGYLLAGIIVGPHLPVPLFADEGLAHQMSELGVVLLMFSLGLEFSLRKLAKVGARASLVALIECSLMIWLGYLVARAFGWSTFESLFTGGLVAISSTTIIVKAFAELGKRRQGVPPEIRDIVFGILIAEDLIAILLLAVLTPVALGAGLSAGKLFFTVGKLGVFLAALLSVGIVVVPRLVRFIVRLGRPETTVVACVGLCFGFALLARLFGYSVALGAFVGGALVAESGAVKIVERLIEPVRDVFAAIFFVSVGMLIDPVLVLENWRAVLVLTVIVVMGKVVGVTMGVFLTGNSVRTSVQSGMSLAQIGEFSFIIAGVGLSLGVVRGFLYPVAVAVSALTALITPYLIRLSGPVASLVDRRLPHPIQTFVTLYGSWVEKLKSTPQRRSAWTRIRKLVVLLTVDAVAIAVVVIAVSLSMATLMALGGRHFALNPALARVLVALVAAALISPFVLGAVRVSRALGMALAAEALPTSEGGLDLAAAPRRALLVTLQLAILLVVGVPLVAVTQPFVPSVPGIALLLLALVILVVPFWRSATNLHGHVRAGAQVILEALARQSQVSDEPSGIHEVKKLMPGLGNTATVQLTPRAPSVGKSLKEIGLRGATGATVIAIERGETDVVYPHADEVLQMGDVLVLTGTDAAVAAARELLSGPPPEDAPRAGANI